MILGSSSAEAFNIGGRWVGIDSYSVVSRFGLRLNFNLPNFSDEAFILFHRIWIELEDLYLNLVPIIRRRPVRIAGDFSEKIAMRHQDDVLLRPFPKEVSHPLRSISYALSIRRPETSLAVPIRDESVEIEAREFGLFL